MRSKKDTLKGFVIGVVLTALIFGSIYAQPITKQIQVLYNDIKIAVDGVIIAPKDAKGNIVQPFSFNGTTYLPVRAIGDALGKEITWDGDTKTIYLGKVIKPSGEIIGISELIPYANSGMKMGMKWNDNERLKIAKTEYENLNSITCSGIGKNGSKTIEFNLDGNYSKLTGKFGVDDSSPNPTDMNKYSRTGAVLHIIGDGNTLYETNLAIKGNEAMPIDMSLIGVKRLKINVHDIGDMTEVRYRFDFVDVKLTKVSQ